MTDRVILQAAKRAERDWCRECGKRTHGPTDHFFVSALGYLPRRHRSETVVMDRIGRRRRQAAPESEAPSLWKLFAIAVFAAPLTFAVMFAFFFLVTA